MIPDWAVILTVVALAPVFAVSIHYARHAWARP